MDTREWDAVVIGGGIAGLSAAQMLGRARRRTLVIDSGSPRNRFAAHMHGVLGHDGTDPAELLARGRTDARAYGVEIASGTVADVQDDGDHLRVVMPDGCVEQTRAVVVATGIRDDLPDLPGMAELWGRSVLHCPYCHGWEVAGQRLGVLATSPASIHQIELVRQWSADVTAFTALAEPLPSDVRARLIARGIRVVTAPVESLVRDRAAGTGTDAELVAVRDVDGVEHAVDAVFVGQAPAIDLPFLDRLALTRADQPGSPLAVDVLGATSHPRVWAAGNVTAPFGNVPLSMGAGSMAGAAVNAALVAEDAARAVAARRDERNAHWEEHYAGAERVWSGRVNATFAAVVSTLTPGTALDLGCGEGADALWLADRGWRVTGLDVSATAIRRAHDAARSLGIGEDRANFLVADGIGALVGGGARDAERGADADHVRNGGDGGFDLVSASFFHSWEPDFPRFDLLRAAAGRVAPGGRLLVISHAAPPSWSEADGHGALALVGPAEELALLGLDPREWTPELVEVRRRDVTAPDGTPATLEDGVLLLRRAH